MTNALHEGERTATAEDVRRLLTAQVPHLAALPVSLLNAGGTDNVLWQIGTDLLGRFPRLPGAAASLAREVAWLPVIPPLGLAIPQVRHAGSGDGDYPFNWAVFDFIPGQDAAAVPLQDAALLLGLCVAALQSARVPPDLPVVGPGRLSPGALGFARKMAAAFTPDEGDSKQILALLDAAEALLIYDGPLVWTHGDLHPLNLLSQNGHLSAIIDWGSLGAGDPARDLICAWTVMDRPDRATFRATLSPDPAAWDRGRAFALVMAVQAIPYYRDSNLRFRAAMQRTLAQVLSDLG